MVTVYFQFAHAFQGGLIRNQRITDTHAEVTQHGGVGQVTLPAGNWQFACQVLQYRVGKAQIPFGVFEVNRVNFMRHGGRTNLTSNGFLFEVVKGDITPDVTVKVDQNGVEARNAIKQFGNVVVWFDLGGVRVPLNTQRGDELFAELMPVNFRVSGDVGVIVTDRAVDFAEDLHLIKLAVLTFHAVGNVCHLFTDG